MGRDLLGGQILDDLRGGLGYWLLGTGKPSEWDDAFRAGLDARH